MVKKMLWIGLTGGIATGKSTAANILRKSGYPVVDADAVSFQVVSPGAKGLSEVVKTFGQQILNSDGTLNRQKLAQLVFSDPTQRQRLEAILHPLIQEEVARQRHALEQQKKSIAFYDVPLLFEKKLQDQFDHTLLIYTPESMQRMRMKQRDQWSDQEMSQRLQSQIPIEDKKNMANFVIENVGTENELQQRLLNVIQLIQSGKT